MFANNIKNYDKYSFYSFNKVVRDGKSSNNQLYKKYKVDKNTLLIVDEAHNIKNIKSGGKPAQSAKYVLSLAERTENCLYLTATPYVNKFSPHYFVTFLSVEGTRIAYGLKIPSIGMNDEPRNEPVCKLIHPFIGNIITPECIPIELYIRLHADAEKIIRYNGLDEIAWISEYTPNPNILKNFDVEKGEYVIIRTETTYASYLIDKFKPYETQICKFFPSIFKEFPNLKQGYFNLPKKQF